MNINIILLFIYSLRAKIYDLIFIKDIISILYNFLRRMDVQPNISYYVISHFPWPTKYKTNRAIPVQILKVLLHPFLEKRKK